MKLQKAAISPMQLLAQMGALQKYNKGQREEMRETHLLELAKMSGRFLAAAEEQSWMAMSQDYSQCSIPPEYETLMSEIQLRNIVQNMDRQGADQQTDGDEIMVKDGVFISKFSREALEVGDKVGSIILGKVRKIFDLNRRRQCIPHKEWSTQDTHEVQG